ncbi:MAG: anti-sigma factor [Cryobacterium sp.]
MAHLDRDARALVALAELELTVAELQHLAVCPGCAGDLEALRRTVLIGRNARKFSLLEPADVVWTRIHAALGLSDDVVSPPHQSGMNQSGMNQAGMNQAGMTAEQPPADARSQSRPVHRGWLPLAAAACAAGIVVGGVGGTWWQSARQSPPVPASYAAQLDPLPGWSGSGRAVVEEPADGHRDVLVNVDLTVEAGSGLREVWLITPDATGLISLGLLDGAQGRFAIPAEIDLSRYAIVDVSAEPNDGDPTHSGVSLVRGELRGV